MKVWMLAVVAAAITNTAASPHLHHHHFPNKRQAEYVTTLGSYEVVTPRKVTSDGGFLSHNLHHTHHPSGGAHPTRSRRQANLHHYQEPHLNYVIPIDGEDRQVTLRPNLNFLAPHAVVERRRNSSVLNGGSLVEVIGMQPSCHYLGFVRNHTASRVALSTCNGLTGYVRTDHHEYLIEPVRDHVHGSPHPHLVYRRSALPTPGAHTCSTPDSQAKAMDAREEWEAAHRPPTATREEGGGRKRRKRSVSLERNVEVTVVADKKMVDFYSNEDINTYILTVMNMVSSVYHDASIGNAVNIYVVRIMLLEDPQYEEELDISHNADDTLRSFCHWQQMINPGNETHPYHHDVAVLITRYNICSRVTERCATLGVSEIAGMCQPLRSCNVNEDTGLQIAYTIAHELGHNFGMNHDGPQNGCESQFGSTQHVMSPHLTSDAIPITWSNCSRQEITHFLDRDWGSCLEDEPPQVEFTFPQLPPGAMYDAHHQCRLSFGAAATHCSGLEDTERVCQTLWCHLDNRCITRMEPAAEGTQCGKHKWCASGQCVTIGDRPAAIHGNWGGWSSWSPCSRTCGAGVSFAQRHCDNPAPANGGRYCTGDRKKYRICSTQECPENGVSFRAVQCSEHDHQPYKGENHTWLPVMFDHSPCQLDCKPDNEFYSVKLGEAVLDGTPCNPGTRDMCIHGVCKRVACDWTIEGGAQEDRCGLCHGDGTQCVTTRGIFNLTRSSGYVPVVTVPRDARNIKVRELRDAANYLALRDNTTARYFLNGNWIIQWSGEYSADGNMMYYTREGETESLFLPGPVKRPLTLMLLFQTENPGVLWEYTLPHQNATYTPSFAWLHADWSVCTVTCGGGTQVSKVQCLEKEAGLVEEQYCNGQFRPHDHARACNTHACPAWWWSGPWQPCAITCGSGGIRRRTVICVRSFGPSEQMALLDSACEESEKPHETEVCPALPPCPQLLEWSVGPWCQSCTLDPCDFEEREVLCVASGGNCDPLSRPPDKRQCGNITCGVWKVGTWSKCSTSCGEGVQFRAVSCEGGLACRDADEPNSVQECIGNCLSDETLLEIDDVLMDTLLSTSTAADTFTPPATTTTAADTFTTPATTTTTADTFTTPATTTTAADTFTTPATTTTTADSFTTPATATTTADTFTTPATTTTTENTFTTPATTTTTADSFTTPAMTTTTADTFTTPATTTTTADSFTTPATATTTADTVTTAATTTTTADTFTTPATTTTTANTFTTAATMTTTANTFTTPAMATTTANTFTTPATTTTTADTFTTTATTTTTANTFTTATTTSVGVYSNGTSGRSPHTIFTTPHTSTLPIIPTIPYILTNSTIHNNRSILTVSTTSKSQRSSNTAEPGASVSLLSTPEITASSTTASTITASSTTASTITASSTTAPTITASSTTASTITASSTTASTITASTTTVSTTPESTTTASTTTTLTTTTSTTPAATTPAASTQASPTQASIPQTSTITESTTTESTKATSTTTISPSSAPTSAQSTHLDEETTVPSDGVLTTAPSGGVLTTAPSGGVLTTAPIGGVLTTAPSGGVLSTAPSGGVLTTAPTTLSSPVHPVEETSMETTYSAAASSSPNLTEGTTSLSEDPTGSPSLSEAPTGSPSLSEAPTGSPSLSEAPIGSPSLSEATRGSPSTTVSVYTSLSIRDLSIPDTMTEAQPDASDSTPVTSTLLHISSSENNTLPKNESPFEDKVTVQDDQEDNEVMRDEDQNINNIMNTTGAALENLMSTSNENDIKDKQKGDTVIKEASTEGTKTQDTLSYDVSESYPEIDHENIHVLKSINEVDVDSKLLKPEDELTISDISSDKKLSEEETKSEHRSTNDTRASMSTLTTSAVEKLKPSEDLFSTEEPSEGEQLTEVEESVKEDEEEQRPDGIIVDQIYVDDFEVIEIVELPPKSEGKKTRKKVLLHSGAEAVDVLYELAEEQAAKKAASTTSEDTNLDYIIPGYQWDASLWSQCSAVCGSGVQRRSVRCRERATNSLVDPQLCGSPPPENLQPCTLEQCGQWAVGEWGECSSSCDRGERVRSIECVGGPRCPSDTRPPEVEPCVLPSCVTWVEGPWSLCTKTCGGGYQIRHVKCVDARTQEAADTCLKDAKPKHKMACHNDRCPKNKRGQQRRCKDRLDTKLCKKLKHMCSTKFFRVKCCRTCLRRGE